MQISNVDFMQDNIDFEMVDTYLKQSRMAVYIAHLLMIYLAASFYGIADTNKIISWVLLIFAIDATIIYTSLKFNHSLPAYQISFFRNRQHILHVLEGCAWGSAFLFLLDARHPLPTDFRLAAALGIVIAFSAANISASVRGLVGFVLPISFFAAHHFLANFAYFGWWFFGLIGLVVTSLYFGHIIHQYILGQAENRLLNATYIDELRALNEKIELNNKDFVQRNLEMQEMQSKLQLLATYDELTGLHNRRYILERITEKLPEIRRHQLDCCVVIMDVDHFKQVNDKYGHAAGDDVLRTTAQVLTRELRHGDVIARYGGEEFLILLPMTELASARLLVERLRSIIEKQIHLLEGKKATVTASFGITQFYSQDTADKMIDRADKALYQAKMAGRNCVKVIAKPD